MTRIEKDSNTQGEMKQLKEDVIKEVRKGKGGKNNKMTCSVIVLFFAVIIVFIGAWTIAATGLVSVPLLSRVAYNPLEPTRVIIAGTPVDVIANETFKTTIAKRLQEGGGVISDRSVSLMIREESLTATVRDVLDQSGLNFLDAKNAQVAIIEKGGFELFTPIHGIGRESALQLNFSAQIDEGNVHLDIGEMKIGSYSVPKVVVKSMFGAMANNELASINNALGSSMKIDRILYMSGEVEFKGELVGELN